jgi:type II secretion system protein I
MTPKTKQNVKRNQRDVPSARRGLSLLEVMLALAILGGALAVIGELTRLGARNAEMARDQTIAQRLCANKMSELSAGLLVPQAVTLAPVEELEDQKTWLYSIEVEQLPQTGMIGVWVTVEQSPDIVSRPVSYTLVRWMMDPQYATTTTDDLTGQTTSSSASATGSSSGASSATGTQ